MSSFAMKIDGQEGTRGPYASRDEVAAALEEYRRQHPDDGELHRVTVWEMEAHGTAGAPRSVWDFVEPS